MKIIRGCRHEASRILLMGVEGVGKSTWACSAPGAIVVDVEGGTRRLDVARCSWGDDERTRPAGFDELREALRWLAREQHDRQTIIVDTVDALEVVLQHDLCRERGWQSIEDAGYGRGYVAAYERWVEVLAMLEWLRGHRSMDVILVAHASKRQVTNPDGTDYVRWEPKLHSDRRTSVSALLKEWSDAVLFAEYEQTVYVEAKGDRIGKAVSTGRRVLRTNWSAAHDGKNRMGLPATLPLDWNAFASARSASAQINGDKEVSA